MSIADHPSSGLSIETAEQIRLVFLKRRQAIPVRQNK